MIRYSKKYIRQVIAQWLKILVVDDEVNIRSMIRKFAEFEGHEVFAGRGWHAGGGEVLQA